MINELFHLAWVNLSKNYLLYLAIIIFLGANISYFVSLAYYNDVNLNSYVCGIIGVILIIQYQKKIISYRMFDNVKVYKRLSLKA